RPGHLRYPPPDRQPADLRFRHPLLPRRFIGPARGAGGARGVLETFPGLGGRLGGAGTLVHVHDARLGNRADHRRSARRSRLTAPTRTRPAGYKCPKEVAVVAELPRNPSGKVLKTVLRG